MPVTSVSGLAESRISIDIGGTFTDIVLVSAGRVQSIIKVLTTADDPSRAIAEGLTRLLEDLDPAGVVELIHATTLVSNALIERKLAQTALVTTAGFRDVLSIGREQRYDLYDLFLEMPRPLVPRRWRWEVTERMLANGEVETPIDPVEVERVARQIRRSGAEGVAVCLLHSYRNPAHEQLVREVIKDVAPEIVVSLSSEVAPEMGEYVRACTTAANVAVLPIIDRYLNRLQGRLDELGFNAPIHIMLSTGGLAPLSAARRLPIRLCESGPAAGALSAVYFGRDDPGDLLAFDMGGTTAKACLIEHKAPLLAPAQEVARVYRFAKGSGIPIRIPTLDLIEVGAGGGSIARRGPMATLKVGPDSASSVPGPVCYGRGGSEPTVTDADLILGYLDPDSFLGGEMRLELEAARRSLGTLGASLSMTAEEVAVGIHRMVNETMASAARVHSIERGRDLRPFTLVATGGAGPVHAWGVGRALGMSKIMFPAHAGVASAVGMLTAAPSFEYARSYLAALSKVDWDEVDRLIATMDAEGRAELAQIGVRDSSLRTLVAGDMRYQGQGEPITVELGEWPLLQRKLVGERFRQNYAALFGREPAGVEPEVLTWRVRVLGSSPELNDDVRSGTSTGAIKTHRPMWSIETKRFVDAPVIDRSRLEAGTELLGPTILEEKESTAIIGVGGRGTVDRHGNVWVEIDG